MEDELESWELAWDSDFGPHFAEHTVGLSAALEATPGLTLGLRGMFMQAADQSGFLSDGAGHGRGRGRPMEGLDRPRPGTWCWVGGGSQLASEWPTRYWRLGVPSTPSTWAWNGTPGPWEASFWNIRTPARARTCRRQERSCAWAPKPGSPTAGPLGLGGAWGAGEDGGLYSAGVGLPFRALGLNAKAAYSLLFGSQQGLRQRLQIQVAWPTLNHGAVVAVPLKVEYEPGTNRILARPRCPSTPQPAASPSKIGRWRSVTSPRHLVRVLRGTAATPPSLVTWDGTVSLGQAVAQADGVT